MNRNSKKARFFAIVLAILLGLTFILPAFTMLVGAEENAFIVDFAVEGGGLIKVGEKATISVTVSDQRVKFEKPEEAPSQDSSNSGDDQSSMDREESSDSGSDPSSDSDYVPAPEFVAPTAGNITVTVVPGSFDVQGGISKTLHSYTDGMNYTIVFKDVVYDGGSAEFSFNVSYTNTDGTPYSVPLKTFSYTITQIA